MKIIVINKTEISLLASELINHFIMTNILIADETFDNICLIVLIVSLSTANVEANALYRIFAQVVNISLSLDLIDT